MNLSDIFENYNITIQDCFLKQTTKNIESFEIDEVVDALKKGYSNKDPNCVKMATLFNSIFTHHAQTFMLTRRSLCDIIKNDENSTYCNINSTEYKLMLSLMIKSEHFQCLRLPKGRRAGVYKVVQPDLVKNLHKLHNIEWFQLQEKKVCEYYDSKDSDLFFKNNGKTSGDIMRENLRKKGVKV